MDAAKVPNEIVVAMVFWKANKIHAKMRLLFGSLHINPSIHF